MTSAEKIHMTNESAPWAHFGWRHTHLLFHQPLAKVEELDRLAILDAKHILVFAAFYHGDIMVSMDYNGNIMISPDIMVFQNGDIMEISWGYNGLNGLVEKLLEFLFSGNLLDLTIGGSGHKSRGFLQIVPILELVQGNLPEGNL